MTKDLLSQHLYNNSGEWKLSLENRDVYITIPEKMAVSMKQMLEWEDDRSNIETAEILRKINCHKAALYLIGKIFYEDLLSDPRLGKDIDFAYEKVASELSQKEFMVVQDEIKLREFAKQECSINKIYIGQIFNVTLGHSFIVGRTQDDKFICFDKAGFLENPLKGNKDYKFRIYEMGMLLLSPNYQNAKWRFVDVEE